MPEEDIGCSVVPSEHARHEMIDDAITNDEARDAIVQGIRRPHKDKKILARLDGIEVVYKEKPCHWWILTAYRG